jgi:mxaJ protein
MSSRCPDRRRAARAAGLAALLATAPAAAAAQSGPSHELVVCADPDAMPYSRADGAGFENRIARLVADDLGLALRYAWQPLRRGLVRRTLDAGRCQLLIGVPLGMPALLTTRSYYRSAYVFVERQGPDAPLRSFDDPRLRRARIGVQLVGDDLAATPPGHALARRGLTGQVRGYPLEGPRPSAQRMLEDLAHGRLDAALLWGPQAGHPARLGPVPLRVETAIAPPDLKAPFAYDIAMGVRRGDHDLRRRLDAVLERRRAEIDAILAEHAVPRVDGTPP